MLCAWQLLLLQHNLLLSVLCGTLKPTCSLCSLLNEASIALLPVGGQGGFASQGNMMGGMGGGAMGGPGMGGPGMGGPGMMQRPIPPFRSGGCHGRQRAVGQGENWQVAKLQRA